MKLSNEAKEQKETATFFYRKYVEGMTPRRIGEEVHADSAKLMKLYKEVVESNTDQEPDKSPGHIKAMRLVNALGNRLSPGRRLILAASIIGFVVQNIFAVPISTLILVFSFAGLLFLLLVELLEKFDAKREIDLAREIQLGLLPAPEFKSDRLSIYSFASTAREVGGDYVDTIHTDRGDYYIIADVSGKGLSASLYMVRLQALFHLLIKKYQPDPKTLLVELNEFIKYSKHDKTFVTACVALAPSDDSPLLFCRAGHNVPLFYSNEKDRCKELRSPGLALGMAPSDKLDQALKQMELKLEPGDLLLMYTDGLTEARNPSGEEYGENRLLSLFELYSDAEPDVLLEKIRVSLEQFIEDAEIPDDVTYSVISRPITVSEETKQLADKSSTEL